MKQDNFRYLIAAAILVAVFFMWVGSSRATLIREYANPEFSSIASSIALTPVVAHCIPNNPDYYGYTDGKDVYLEHEICDALNLLLHHRFRKGQRAKYHWSFDRYYMLGAALVTITHESGHVRFPAASEGAVECWAVRHARSTLRRYFNQPTWMRRIILREAHAFHRDSAPEYRTVC